jgi:hypothetical protein
MIIENDSKLGGTTELSKMKELVEEINRLDKFSAIMEKSRKSGHAN